MLEKSEIPKEDIEKNKDIAALGYAWIFSIIILLARRESPFIQLHARQGTLLFIFSIVLWPLGVLRYGEFLILALMLLGFIQAAMGQVYRIPIIAQLAEGTLRWYHIKKGWHNAKHTAIKLVKPEHITPEFRAKLQRQEGELLQTEKSVKAEERILVEEEKKLSSLFNRLAEDEKKIGELKSEVSDLENKVDSLQASR